MKRVSSPGFRVSIFAAAALFLVLPVHGEAPRTWPVKGATMRFQVEIENEPSDPSAGNVVILQNGGNLPNPAAEAVILDSGSNELRNECIWNNPHEGMGIVFESPKVSGPIWIYLRPVEAIKNPWTDASSFRPGLLLFTKVGTAGLQGAKAMSVETPPGKSARMGLVPMVADRANRFGPSDNYFSYYTGWINAAENGNYYFATISQDGSTVAVDGKMVVEWPGLHSADAGGKGEKGGTVALTKGPHRVEYYYFCGSRSCQALLAWRTPSMGKAQPTCPRGTDWLQSGLGRIVSAETLSGVPVAFFEKLALNYLGFNGEWVDLYELSAPFADQSKDATYTWKFTGGYEAKGPTVVWPVVRNGPAVQVTLTISTVSGASTNMRLLYPDTLPKGAKVDKPEVRQMFRDALLTRIKGKPASRRPAEDWSKGIWGLLPEVIEPGEGKELLDELFQHSAQDMDNLQPGDLAKLQDIYCDELGTDPKSATDFFSRVISDEKDPGNRFRWQFRQVDFYLNEIGDVNAARKLSAQLQLNALHASPEEAAFRVIQLGDIERMDGNLDQARQFYIQAQADYRRATHAETPMGSAMSRPTPEPSKPKDPKENEKGKEGFVIAAAGGAEADWRKRTVRQNAHFAEVKNLLEQGYLAEAKQTLNTWQLEFPMDKLAGDYAIAEAGYYSGLQNYPRAVRILKGYRKSIEISKDLPESMQLEWDCLAQMQSLDELKELATDIKKRFPDLPLAKSADDVLAGNLPPKPEKKAPVVRKRPE